MTRYSRCFFFSSRRRHTRYWRDWSSDVCSSDLDGLLDRFPRPDVILGQHVLPFPAGDIRYRSGTAMAAADTLEVRMFGRSEERRVGKECRSRWSPYH